MRSRRTLLTGLQAMQPKSTRLKNSLQLHPSGNAGPDRKVDNQRMRFRATWAALLTALILSLSCAASACEMRCDLKSAGPSCHSLSGSHAAIHPKHMTRMLDMDRSSGNETAAFEPQSSLLVGLQTCAHHTCVQRPFLLPQSTTAITHAMAASHVAVRALLAVPQPGPRTRDTIRGSPHRERSSPIALHTTLRV